MPDSNYSIGMRTVGSERNILRLSIFHSVEDGPAVGIFAARTAKETLTVALTTNTFKTPEYVKDAADFYMWIDSNRMMYVDLPLWTSGSPILGGTYGFCNFILDRLSAIDKANAHEQMYKRFDPIISEIITAAYTQWTRPENVIPRLDTGEIA